MTSKHTCVAVYLMPALAEEALARLQEAGVDMSRLSFVGRDTWANAAGSYNTRGGFKYCGTLGPFWVKLWSILFDQGIFWFYANGPMLVAGPLVGMIVAAQEDARCDPSVDGFAGGLSGIGIPEESIAQYKEDLDNDRILLFVIGSLEEIDRADRILNETEEIDHSLHHTVAAA